MAVYLLDLAADMLEITPPPPQIPQVYWGLGLHKLSEARMEKSEKRMMAMVFWDHEGVLHTKYLRVGRKKGRTVTNGLLSCS